MMKAVFVTGTDTGVGKTVVCGLLAGYLLDKGKNVITQKWIQTGCGNFSADIAEHLKFMGKKAGDFKNLMPHIIPYVFALPASPHLAAAAEGKIIRADKIRRSFRKLSEKFEFVIVEGIGGALVPYNKKRLVIDIAEELRLPVIIVAENRLGAINHTLLTIEAVRARGMKIIGIIFNNPSGKENEKILKDNPEIIRLVSGVKILGTLGRQKNKKLLQKAFSPIGRKILVEIK
jgi:dethiobiotin synthetase